jgi:hypothetical protein
MATRLLEGPSWNFCVAFAGVDVGVLVEKRTPRDSALLFMQ